MNNSINNNNNSNNEQNAMGASLHVSYGRVCKTLNELLKVCSCEHILLANLEPRPTRNRLQSFDSLVDAGESNVAERIRECLTCDDVELEEVKLFGADFVVHFLNVDGGTNVSVFSQSSPSANVLADLKLGVDIEAQHHTYDGIRWSERVVHLHGADARHRFGRDGENREVLAREAVWNGESVVYFLSPLKPCTSGAE